MATSKLSKKYQITIPKKVREKLGLKKGSKVSIKEKGGGQAVLEPVDSLTEKYKGLGKEAWNKLGGADNYLNQERISWDRKN